jgi:hypothetical protein
VLRIDFVPQFVTADGKPMAERKDLGEPGFTFDNTTHVLRVRHDDAHSIDIQGEDGAPAVKLVTFDDPHLAAGTVLQGAYPAGAIEWGKHQWAIHVPQGKFGTFNLALADSTRQSAEFRFYSPRFFVGIDVYNGGPSEATVTIQCPEMREVTFTIKPGELRRLRTQWPDRSSKISFDFQNGEGLIFDNLAYRTD